VPASTQLFLEINGFILRA